MPGRFDPGLPFCLPESSAMLYPNACPGADICENISCRGAFRTRLGPTSLACCIVSRTQQLNQPPNLTISFWRTTGIRRSCVLRYIGTPPTCTVTRDTHSRARLSRRYILPPPPRNNHGRRPARPGGPRSRPGDSSHNSRAGHPASTAVGSLQGGRNHECLSDRRRNGRVERTARGSVVEPPHAGNPAHTRRQAESGRARAAHA